MLLAVLLCSGQHKLCSGSWKLEAGKEAEDFLRRKRVGEKTDEISERHTVTQDTAGEETLPTYLNPLNGKKYVLLLP